MLELESDDLWSKGSPSYVRERLRGTPNTHSKEGTKAQHVSRPNPPLPCPTSSSSKAPLDRLRNDLQPSLPPHRLQDPQGKAARACDAPLLRRADIGVGGLERGGARVGAQGRCGRDEVSCDRLGAGEATGS